MIAGYNFMQHLILVILLVPTLSLAQVDSIYINDTANYYVEYWEEELDTNAEAVSFWEVDFYKKEFHFVLISQIDSTVIGRGGFKVPKQYIHRVKTDSVMNAGIPKYQWRDSIDIVDHEGVRKFYLDSVRVDTIALVQPTSYRAGDLNSYDIAAYRFYKKLRKHGPETVYYSIDDLRGVLITGTHFRLKEKGDWKKGHKVGKWYYYSKNGELERREKWRRGKLIRTKYPH